MLANFRSTAGIKASPTKTCTDMNVCTPSKMVASSTTTHRLLFERNGFQPGKAPVDGKEVAIVGHEIARGRLLVVRDDLCREQPVPMAVGDQGGPLGVDVEFHRAHGTCPLEDRGQRSHRLVI